MGYEPRAWDSRSLQSMLNGILHFGVLEILFFLLKTALSPLYNNNDNNNTFSISCKLGCGSML